MNPSVKNLPIAPLTEEETAELRELLETGGGASLAFARGVFAAVSTVPTRKDVTDWLPLIVSDQVPDRAQLKRVFGLLMRDFHACEHCLSLGVPAVPAPDDTAGITEFCKGYLRVAQADARFKADMEAFALTVPLAVLSGYVALDSLVAFEPELLVDPEVWCEKQRQQLSDTTARLHAYFAPLRASGFEMVAGKGKVARNELCPCGSGKKYKKCCGVS